MAVITCAFHHKDGKVEVKTAVTALTKGDKIQFNSDDSVLVTPSAGVVDLVVAHNLEISATEEGAGAKKRFIVTFDPVGGGGGGNGGPG